jgi:phosphatidylserine decarboxylase
LQAKGLDYTATALLGRRRGNSPPIVSRAATSRTNLPRAALTTIALHMPARGNPAAFARFIPADYDLFISDKRLDRLERARLFTRNERVACVFDTAAGALAKSCWSARLFVGSVEPRVDRPYRASGTQKKGA